MLGRCPFSQLVRTIGRLARRKARIVGEPCAPAGGNPGSIRNAVVDNPASFGADRTVDERSFGAIVPVAKLVLTDRLSEAPRIEPGAERFAVPPREELKPESFHCRRQEVLEFARNMASRQREVQPPGRRGAREVILMSPPSRPQLSRARQFARNCHDFARFALGGRSVSKNERTSI